MGLINNLHRGTLRQLVRFSMGNSLNPRLPVEKQRSRINLAASGVPRLWGIKREKCTINNVAALWLSKQIQRKDAVLLFIHGGAFVVGSAATHADMAARLGHAAGLKTLLPLYRLAPEHPYPAALDDCMAAYDGLLNMGYTPDQIAVAGDSAGGQLALALCLALASKGIPGPAVLMLYSPLTDLTYQGESFKTKAGIDPMLKTSWAEFGAQAYAGDHDRAHPLLSPLNGDLSTLPPTLIQVGTDEILLDDSKRLHSKMRKAGKECRLEIAQGLWHDYQGMAGAQLPEAKQAISRAAAFIRSRI